MGGTPMPRRLPMTFSRTYADWKAPPADGGTLIWPEPASFLEQTRQNHALLAAAESPIAGVPLRDLRRRMRTYLGFDADTLIVATGHQSELYHPGVWAKNALIDAAANALGGQGLHVSVDTDAPKHLAVKWPGHALPITDDPALLTAGWTGRLDQPTPVYLSQVQAAFDAAASGWDFTPDSEPVFSSLRRLGMEGAALPDALANAFHQLDWSLGLRHHSLTLSPAFNSRPYQVFVHHLLARAGVFLTSYNGALADYRKQHRTTSPQRPMPDLAAGAGEIECPFWLDDLETGERSRASVRPAARGFALMIGDETFELTTDAGEAERAVELHRWLVARRHRLAPRALTLTMFLRLFVADQFVHGIGGGRYDQVTDRIIADFLAVEPPAFAVTTATLFFPEAIGRDRVCLPCVEMEGHQLKHDALGPDKAGYLKEIEKLPRDSAARRRVFERMRRDVDAAAEQSAALAAWRSRYERAQDRAASEAELFDRELPYFVQPRDRLAGLIDRYRDAFA